MLISDSAVDERTEYLTIQSEQLKMLDVKIDKIIHHRANGDLIGESDLSEY